MKSKTVKLKRRVKGIPVVDGAGVKLKRIIGSYELNHIDPFVLLDEFKSTDAKDYSAGFPMHPHRGIETITYMIKGRFRHKDSKGHGGLLTDGCVQWMTAGKGILHSEMPEQKSGQLWGYQLWLSLPAKDKMVEARYQHLSPEMIPTVRKDDMEVKVISGEYDKVKGPAENWVSTHYFDVYLHNRSTFHFELQRGMNCFCYVHSGAVTLSPSSDPQPIEQGELVELQGEQVQIKCKSEEAGLLFLAARPNNEPIARGGPFVMNTEEEIRQAFHDYHNGKLF
jgi:redox-sensitive bicupin YhaK (pirin superfamily)